MICRLCGNVIPEERMEALPETELCVGCSAKVGGEVVMIANEVRTSKEGSMKINYGGGVDVRFVRKWPRSR
ncbi:MAG: TraR/DksA C4-type zinc finger protein [Candidatus Melainabacteria bacterium]|nr:TraR/DksA C4-type zinc finger protein [Candidatus Melainabacteria bacterium]